MASCPSQNASNVNVDADAPFWNSKDMLLSEFARHPFSAPRPHDRCRRQCGCRRRHCAPCVLANQNNSRSHPTGSEEPVDGHSESECVSLASSACGVCSVPPVPAERGEQSGGGDRRQVCREGRFSATERRCHCTCSKCSRPCRSQHGAPRSREALQRLVSRDVEAVPSDLQNPPDEAVIPDRFPSSGVPSTRPCEARVAGDSHSRKKRCPCHGMRLYRRLSTSELRQSVSASPVQRPAPARGRILSPAFVLYPPQHPPCPTTASAARLLDLVLTGEPSDRCAVDIGGTLAKVVFVMNCGARESRVTDRAQTPTPPTRCCRDSDRAVCRHRGDRGHTRVPEGTEASTCEPHATAFCEKRRLCYQRESVGDTADSRDCLAGSASKQPHVHEPCGPETEGSLRASPARRQEGVSPPLCTTRKETDGADQSLGTCGSSQRTPAGEPTGSRSPPEACTTTALALSAASPDPASHAFSGGSDASEGPKTGARNVEFHAADHGGVTETPVRTSARRQCVRCRFCRGERKAGTSLTIRATPQHVIRFTYFYTKDVASLLHFLKANGFAQPGGVLRATGGGAHKFSALFLERLGVQLKKLDEMESIMKGLVCLASSTDSVFRFDLQKKQRIHVHVTTPLYPFLVVNIGSGVSILKATSPSSFVRVTGTCIGGGTVLGLARLLFHAKTFKQVVKLSQRGTDLLDLKVGDLFGDAAGSRCLPADTLASSFGRLYLMTSQEDGNLLRKNLRKEDVARSLIHMVSYNLGYLAYLVGTAHGVRRIFFAGKYINNHEFTMESITHGVNFYMRQYDAAASAASIPAPLHPLYASCSRELSSLFTRSSKGRHAVPVMTLESHKNEHFDRGPVASGVTGHLPASRLSPNCVQGTEAKRKLSICFRNGRIKDRKEARSESSPPRLGTERRVDGSQRHYVPDVRVLGHEARFLASPHPDSGRSVSESQSTLACGPASCAHAGMWPQYGTGFTGVDRRNETKSTLQHRRNSHSGRTGNWSIPKPETHVPEYRGRSSSIHAKLSGHQRASTASTEEDTLSCSPFSPSGKCIKEAQRQDYHIIPSEPSSRAEGSARTADSRQGPVLFLRHDGYLGALGALVAAGDSPTENPRS
ncbi:hypothetical protein NCLIV_060530 [Neospora caninum Liverpool]|uniref:Pantothenate kinase n=1 Tax=Neospora caninum (strain Liverpool) TaxID=572307 RepID=F0VPI2_NEOCL|nr:hypothetical protein NCLIV_060530 [Neospora caninum Liverpool]CBZ55628.1 hypothetical protein NCLIV_060530 [Neospora caninum Liverpool]|eukprot:XP_003885656.1 hypothetical protein NCLIV_060530 [Neospora caninum Liverpool]